MIFHGFQFHVRIFAHIPHRTQELHAHVVIIIIIIIIIIILNNCHVQLVYR